MGRGERILRNEIAAADGKPLDEDVEPRDRA
jgi:hypothetical protein